jgi:beta-N-acetylhexosaminidase
LNVKAVVKKIFCTCTLILCMGLMPFTLQANTSPKESGLMPGLEAMVGQMIMVGFRGTTLAPDSPVARALAGSQIGGVILFSQDVVLGRPRNVESPQQVRSLIAQVRAAAPGPIFVAVDQEGGRVQRLNAANGFSNWPSARNMGQGTPEDTRHLASNMAEQLAKIGFDLNFAPVVDLHMADSAAIGKLDRAFSPDPTKVVAHARAFVEGMTAHGIISALKHFPGHGSARGDTHDGFVDASSTWTPTELEPYRVLINEGFSGMIMGAHITLNQYGNLPADLNPAIINGLLRHDLGWRGVIVTDDLQMNALADHYSLEDIVLLAVNAGSDLLIFGNNTSLFDPDIAAKAHAALMGHIRAGRISEERIRESWQRLQSLKTARL